MKNKEYIFSNPNLLLTILIVLSINSFAQHASLTQTQELTNFPTMSCCPASLNDDDYQVVFEDEFNGTNLDPNEWITVGPEGDRCENNQYSEPSWTGEEGENVFVNNGNLKLKVDNLDPGVICNDKPTNYSGGQIWSKRAFRYGRIESRIKLPFGEALIFALWMDARTDDSNDEIDLIETFGNRDGNDDGAFDDHPKYAVNVANNAFWGPNDNYTSFQKYFQTEFPMDIKELTSDVWHDIKMDWTPYTLKIWIDNTLTFETHRYYGLSGSTKTPILCDSDPADFVNMDKLIENMAFPDSEMYLVYSALARPTQEIWGFPISESNTTFPVEAEMDYIRVSQVPASFWGACESDIFCTYSFYRNHRENELVKICELPPPSEPSL